MHTETLSLVPPMSAAETDRLTIYVSGSPIHELAFRTAADMVANGEKLIVVDAVGCFDPEWMTRFARRGALNPAGLLKHLHIFRASTCRALEETILTEMESAFDRFDTRHVLITDPLNSFYDSDLLTRDAARTLGRVKSKLESLSAGGAQIVVLCHRKLTDLGTRSHFVSSLCASADRVYFRNNT